MRISDWSSDVCSSDLSSYSATSRVTTLPEPIIAHVPMVTPGRMVLFAPSEAPRRTRMGETSQSASVSGEDRKSVVSGKSVSVRVDLGGRRIIKKKNQKSKKQKYVIHENIIYIK